MQTEIRVWIGFEKSKGSQYRKLSKTCIEDSLMKLVSVGELAEKIFDSQELFWLVKENNQAGS